MNRIDWDTYFMNIAEVIKTRSPDTKLKVGCVIVDNNHKILSTGYNGLPKKSNDNIDWTNRELVHKLIIHAEINALLFSSKQGHILYTTTIPCSNCLKFISATDIKKIVYKYEYNDIINVKHIAEYLGIEIINLI